MGQAASNPSAGAGGSSEGSASSFGDGKRSRVPGLPKTGRYVAVPLEGGGTVHVLGIVPASPLSAEEAFDLVTATAPKFLYVDEHPEIVSALEEEVAAGRCGHGFQPTETPVPFKWRSGAGLFGSIMVRQKLVDNEMFALLGGELYAPHKAAMLAATHPPPPVAGTPAATPAEIISYPFPFSYNNYNLAERAAHYVGRVFGDAATTSTAVTAVIHNPWLEQLQLPPLVQLEASTPASRPYFTRRDVNELQGRNRQRLVEATVRSTAESADVEQRMQEHEGRYSQDPESQNALVAAGVSSQSQSQAVAFVLREAGSRLGPGESGVALVNVGGLASLQRNWAEARPPQEAFPPMSPVAVAAGYAVPSTLGAGALYGWYRLGRRMPKTIAGITVVLGGVGALMANGLVHSENMLYGPFIRSALARPRVTSPTGGVRS